MLFIVLFTIEKNRNVTTEKGCFLFNGRNLILMDNCSEESAPGGSFFKVY